MLCGRKPLCFAAESLFQMVHLFLSFCPQGDRERPVSGRDTEVPTAGFHLYNGGEQKSFALIAACFFQKQYEACNCFGGIDSLFRI